jgi:hypothetical protein
MPDVHHTWTDVFQRPSTVWWTWPVGEFQHYWGFSFRPLQANEPHCEIISQFTSSDNNLNHTQHLLVRVDSGNLYRLSAIWVVGT